MLKILKYIYSENGIIKNPRVFEAMASIDRAFYSRNNPYQDSPQRIGYSATISAPHMVSYHSILILFFKGLKKKFNLINKLMRTYKTYFHFFKNA